MQVSRRCLYLVAGAVGAAALAGPYGAKANTFCSVFNHYPCAPSACSVLARHPCRPFYGFPLGENLQLTIESKTDDRIAQSAPDHAEAATQDAAAADAESPDAARHDINTIREMFAALRACWQPPETAHEGMQMSVRFSFTRAGKLKGEPRVTYFTPGTPDDAKRTYRDAIDSALDRCTPMAFTSGMAGAIAGRPIAVRFIDNRKSTEDHP